MTVKKQLFNFISSIETPRNKHLMESIRTGFTICFEDGEVAEPAPEDSELVANEEPTPEEEPVADNSEDGTEESTEADGTEPQPEPPPPADPNANAPEINEPPTPEQVNVEQFAKEFVQSGHVAKAIENMKSEVANGSKLTEELLKKKIAYEMGVFCNEKNYATIGEDNIAKLTEKIVAILKKNKQ